MKTARAKLWAVSLRLRWQGATSRAGNQRQIVSVPSPKKRIRLLPIVQVLMRKVCCLSMVKIRMSKMVM